jgi:hypothetical protein
MESLLSPMQASGDERRYFLSVYMRTTRAVKEDLERGGFVDAEWTERWDIVFADLYLDALTSWNANGTAPGPWQIAFESANTAPRVPPIRHLLLGMNAHINYDLPQALIAVISDEEFDDPAVVTGRALDHKHIDQILTRRVPAEDKLLRRDEQPGDRTLLDRLLTPFNRAGTKRFLREARQKVWRNARALSRERRDGEGALAARVEELGVLSAARVADLRQPGQVILRLSKDGFGVLLPGA